jgi:very-short-patch-repair endonuclease
MRRSEQPWQTLRSRAHRSNETSAEAKLWQHLRNRQLGGWKFVGQAPVGAYFGDFLCRELKLVIEVDGPSHGESHEVAADADRTRELEAQGYRVLRITNTDIFENLDGALDWLLRAIEKTRATEVEQAPAPHPDPLPRQVQGRGRGER